LDSGEGFEGVARPLPLKATIEKYLDLDWLVDVGEEAGRIVIEWVWRKSTIWTTNLEKPNNFAPPVGKEAS
jgi:hypothetical protein